MAITNLQLITDALREINVINEVQSPGPEDGAKSLRKLNQMMEEWKENSRNVGYFRQTSTADTCPIPDYAENAVTLALAVYVAPSFSTAASDDTKFLANKAVKTLTRKLIVEKLDNTEMTHLPEGSGHWGNRYDITKDQ